MFLAHEDNGPAPGNACRPGKKVQLVEVAVFLFLIVPSMAASLFLSRNTGLSFTTVAVSSILDDLAFVSLILYFIWRNGEPRGQIGWKSGTVWPEIGLGGLLYFPILYGIGLLESFLHSIGLSAPTKLPSFLTVSGAERLVLACILVAVVAIAEETIFRGYLILRFRTITGSSVAAVLLSSLIFALGHGYEGVAGMISVFVLGIIFAVIYLWRKSLVAPMVIHFLTDFISIVVAALPGMK
jgi:membrane protease YdiL (CAAX protease family)